MNRKELNWLRAIDRTELKALLTRLNGAKNSLRRDECGDWTIFGSHGTIRACNCNGVFYAFLGCASIRAWNAAKKQIGLPVYQDGDDEGILRFSEATDGQIVKLREYLGLRQTRNPPPNAFHRGPEWVSGSPIN